MNWMTGRSRFDPWQRQEISPLASVSRLALRLTQPPVQWVPGVLSPGLKRGRGVTLTTHPHLEPRARMSSSYTSSPLRLHRCVVRLLYLRVFCLTRLRLLKWLLIIVYIESVPFILLFVLIDVPGRMISKLNLPVVTFVCRNVIHHCISTSLITQFRIRNTRLQGYANI
jgi:hypothetical protein